MIVTMEMVYLMTFPFNADSSTLWLMPEVLNYAVILLPLPLLCVR